jgi:hypothetical protein
VRERLLLGAGFVLAYFWAFPYFERLKSANELPRVLQTQELVERGTPRIDRRMVEVGSRFDISVVPGRPPHYYPNKAPGVSLAGVPVWAAAKAFGARTLRAATWALRAFVVTVPALVFLPFFLLLARRFAPDPAPRRAALVAWALGSLALPYGILFFSHVPAAITAGGAFVAAVRLVRGEARWWWAEAGAAGLLAGAAVLFDYQAILAAAAVAGYVVWRSPRRLRDTAVVAAGALPPAFVLAIYHEACFGAPWRTGYAFAADAAHKEGVLGVIGPNGPAMWNALLDPANGLLVLMPWVVLAGVGAVAIWRDRAARERCGPEAIVCAVVALGYVVFLGSLVPEFGRAGWSVGPRYITVALPFFAWLAAAGLQVADRHPAARVGAHGLIVASVIVYAVAATTYPHWPEYLRNPLYELSFRALDEGYAPLSIGRALGLRGLWSLLPMYVIVAALTAWLLGVRDRRRLATTAAAFALAAGIVTSYQYFPRTDRAHSERAWKFVTTTFPPK